MTRTPFVEQNPTILVDPPADFVPPRRVVGRPRLSQRHPALYPVARKILQARRQVRWLTGGEHFAADHQTEPLAHRVKQHNSLLMRELSPDEMHLQRNKVVNLRLASQRVNGLLIGPGQTFSFNKVVGNCTRAKGYQAGMRLSNGRAVEGVGGGICQLANLLVWMFMHSQLTITERSEHSFDPFPDKGRVLPWGVGCSIVYNDVDLMARNDTQATFQILVQVGERLLEGELRSDRAPEFSFKVQARDEQFIKFGQDYYRRNEIWRTVVDRRSGNVVGEELLKKNCALVTYVPSGEVIDATGWQGPSAQE